MPRMLQPEDDRNETLRGLLADLTRQGADAPALLSPACAVISRADLLREIDHLGELLHRGGIEVTDRVALVARPGHRAAISLLGIACHAVCIPFNPANTTEESRALLQETHARALLVMADDVEGPTHLAATQLGIKCLVPSETDSGSPRASSLPTAEDTALIMVTSGTTEKPKIVPITHAQLLARVRKSMALLGIVDGDRCLNLMPLHYMHGLNSGLIGPIFSGGSTICPPSFDPAAFSAGVNELRATWYTAGATYHQAIHGWLLDTPGLIDGHSLRFARSGSAPLPARVQCELEECLGVPVIESYSSTETGTMTANPPQGARKPGTVGCGINGELAVVDANGRRLPPGVMGEVVARGPCIVRGYENNAALNEAAFRQGWFYTGDIGMLDADGYLTLGGRLKDIINRGGEKISPAEIDAMLLTHPSVEEAISFAIPHPTLYQDVAAFVVLCAEQSCEEAELRDYLRTRLTSAKVPRRILCVDHIEKGPTGKPVRAAQSDRFINLIAERPDPVALATLEERYGPITALILMLWRKVLRQDDLGLNSDFFETGGNSLTAVSLLTDIETALQIRVTIEDLLQYPTPRQLAEAAIGRRVGKGRDVLAFNVDGTMPPIFAICGRYGYALRLAPLGQALGYDQPFYALQPPGMDWDAAGLHGIPSMAAHYIAVIRDTQPNGPYRLIGSSFGGLMVFEIACQLQQAGERVELLALVDTSMPSYRLGERVVKRAANRMREHGDNPKSQTAMAGIRTCEVHIRAREAYMLDRQFDGEIIYFICTSMMSVPRRDSRRLWRHFASGGARYIPLPGAHSEMHLEPQLTVLQTRLGQCLHGAKRPTGLPLTWLFNSYRLKRANSRLFIKPRFRPAIPVVGRAHGCVRHIRYNPVKKLLVVRGWATDPGKSLVKSRLLAFMNDRYVGCVACSGRNGDLDLVRRQPELRNAGFEFHLLMPGGVSAEAGYTLRLFLISRDSRLAWLLAQHKLASREN